MFQGNFSRHQYQKPSYAIKLVVLQRQCSQKYAKDICINTYICMHSIIMRTSKYLGSFFHIATKFNYKQNYYNVAIVEKIQII